MKTMTMTIEAMKAVETLLGYISEDPQREGLKDTPLRVVRSYDQIFGGYLLNPADEMKVFEDGACDEMVLLKEIEFYSVCEHHMQPFFGKAHIAYIPNGRVIGVSKLARVLDIYARRLQIQERICQQVVSALMEHLQPKGAACILEAKHFCMVCRGVQKQNSVMVTSSLEGVFKRDPATRQELYSLINS
jgi:GTP cyclohydrolase I